MRSDALFDQFDSFPTSREDNEANGEVRIPDTNVYPFINYHREEVMVSITYIS